MIVLITIFWNWGNFFVNDTKNKINEDEEHQAKDNE